MPTRHTRISVKKAALHGSDYMQTWVGTRAVYTTWDGERRIGTITHWRDGWPCITFAEGTWARLTSHIEVADA